MISSISPLKFVELIVAIRIVPTVKSQGRSNRATIGADGLCLQTARVSRGRINDTVTPDLNERVLPKSKLRQLISGQALGWVGSRNEEKLRGNGGMTFPPHCPFAASGEGLLDLLDGPVDLALGDDQRRGEADRVLVGVLGE